MFILQLNKFTSNMKKSNFQTTWRTIFKNLSSKEEYFKLFLMVLGKVLDMDSAFSGFHNFQ